MSQVMIVLTFMFLLQDICSDTGEIMIALMVSLADYYSTTPLQDLILNEIFLRFEKCLLYSRIDKFKSFLYIG